MKKPAVLLHCALLVLLVFSLMAASAKTLDNYPIANYFFETAQPTATIGVIFHAVPFQLSTPVPESTGFLPDAEGIGEKPSIVVTPAPTPVQTRRRTAAPAPTPAPEGVPVFTSFGLYWREVLPRVTEEWFMVTPLDLSADGEQIYPLVASGTLIVGQVRVTVAGGTARVDCETVEGVQTLSEFLTFFPDLDSVKTISLPLLSRQNYPFRSPISVRSTFGEDRLVLMYINNSVAFDPALPGLSRFDEELYRPWMQDMLTLLD